MFGFFRKKKNDPSLERLYSETYELWYPAHYIRVSEGSPYTNGFCGPVRDITGVLRFTVMVYNSPEAAKKIMEASREKIGQATVTIGPHECLESVSQKTHSSTDGYYWPDTGEPILMYCWVFTHGKHLFFFSYRIPESYTRNGKYAAERPLIDGILASAREI